jgi:mannosyltransferase OCH1-like enzyme
MIPKTFHQIWVGPEKMPRREKQFYFELRDMHHDYESLLWTDDDINDLNMPPKMKALYDLHYAAKKYAFCADVLRLFVVYTYGGIYCDVDFKPLQRLDHFLQFDGFFCYHPSTPTDFTIVNGVFGAEKEHPIMKHLVEATQDNAWWVGPAFCGEEIKKFFNLPYETDQNILKQRLFGFGFEYYDWRLFEEKFMKHHALYSWR